MLKISLITLTKNSEATIKRTLKSVENQNTKVFEHIFIDCLSDDNTIKIIESLNFNHKIISEKDNGIYDAFNKGIKNSSGDIIGFLNSDDTFYDENSLKMISEAFEENIDCVFGDLIYTNKNNKIRRVWKGTEFRKGSFKRGWMPAHPTFYCRKSIYEKYGLYKDCYRIAGDFELMLRFFEKHNINAKYIPYNLINMKIGGISNSGLKSKLKILSEEFRAFKENEISLNKILYIIHKAKKIKEFIILSNI